ncbi:uncharacterized protein LOC135115472 [Scylla paramamosain]|uniref:uncharacterized protein LOC135115472 n=1 Tax=Scylla paramamosain TaxID=85552 RepID=UPI0030830799
MAIRTSTSLPLLLLALLGEVQAQDVVEVHLKDLLSGVLQPLKGLTPYEVGGIRGSLLIFGISMIETAAIIYFAKKKYRIMVEKANSDDEEDNEMNFMEALLSGMMDAAEEIRQSSQMISPPPIPLRPLPFPPDLQRSSRPRKRSVGVPPPAGEDLWELLGGLLRAKDTQKVVVKAVRLVKVMEMLTQNILSPEAPVPPSGETQGRPYR